MSVHRSFRGGLAPEKSSSLPFSEGASVLHARTQRKSFVKAALWSLCAVGVLISGHLFFNTEILDDLTWRWIDHFQIIDSTSAPAVCPQQQPFQLKTPLPNVELDLLADRLSKAVQIDTSVGDGWPNPDLEPEKWLSFNDFAAFLEQAFPKVHQQINLEKVHQHGLLYTWKGSEPLLKPLLMMAHQDVVPVNPDIVDEWIHPPFQGFIDRENQTVWGRGSVDCKSWLISVLSAAEKLLEDEFHPKRTILFSFGFDEESSGYQGASYLSARIQEVWGRDGIAMVVDEGNPILSSQDPLSPGIDIALPGVEEKGYMDIEVKIETAGGHSSNPPAHTSIGLISRVVAAVEDARDKMSVDHLVEGAQLKFLQCIRDAPHFPPNLRAALKDLEWASRSSLETMSILAPATWLLPNLITSPLLDIIRHPTNRGRQRRIRHAKQRVVDAMPEEFKTPFITTTAADIISGGVKLNALPESGTAQFNHRIASSSSTLELQSHYVDILKPIAEKYGLRLEAFGQQVELQSKVPAIGRMTVKGLAPGLEPAPKTPLEGDEASAWRLFSSLIRAVWKDQDGTSVRVAPSMMQGNTDTRYYHNLTSNIFRFGPTALQLDKTGLGHFTGLHSVNEHYAIQGLQDSVNFYVALFEAVSEEQI